ncbi:MAG: MaoC family dehydratase [Chloroflexota bacterium]
MSENTTVTSVAQLKALEGQETGVSSWLEITQERINAFADATGDHQYIHVDPARAANTPFGTTIAHGYLTLSLLPLLGSQREGVKVEIPTRMVVNYGSNRVRFVSPVKVGKRIRLRTKLISVEEVSPSIIQTVNQQTIEIEGEERPAMVAETIGRLYL